jgi:hypothetical protein
MTAITTLLRRIKTRTSQERIAWGEILGQEVQTTDESFSDIIVKSTSTMPTMKFNSHELQVISTSKKGVYAYIGDQIALEELANLIAGSPLLKIEFDDYLQECREYLKSVNQTPHAINWLTTETQTIEIKCVQIHSGVLIWKQIDTRPPTQIITQSFDNHAAVRQVQHGKHLKWLEIAILKASPLWKSKFQNQI